MKQQKDNGRIPENPQWYKDAIIYELHVRTFYDSNGDGYGDFQGLTEKLDYLQDLGVTAIWLLPFYPSPLRDDGYDIADYTKVNPTYGTMQDVRRFVSEAHRRGLRVITELVCNHTSDQHEWFQRARQAKPGSAARNFYVWSDTTEKYQDARIIFKDFETSNWAWDPVAGAYYWHRFYSHQPDLNFEHPSVQKALLKVMDFWLEMGVDGLRLDAVPYLYEQEGTNCENLAQTHEYLRTLRTHIDNRFGDRMLLAEANQWPEDAVAYFGNGDECHMAFHFPLMPRMFMATHMEDRFPIIDILAQTPAIPETSQWALFLRNHDELTLEMVTDEERDYMYRVYAHDPQARINLGIRRRLGPLLGNNRRKIELLNGLLFSLPGTPVLYYGDEIGMGDNIYLGDRDSVRTPMQWSGDRNAGFSRANPQKLYLPTIIDPEYHYETVNVEAQQNNPHSILWWTKRLIALRKRYAAFGRGTIEFLHPDNRKVLVFIRQYEDEQILVVANLSRFVQYVELDLSQYEGLVPVELFSRNDFPPIGSLPYFVTLAPHSFYWFSLEPQRVSSDVELDLSPATTIPVLSTNGAWQDLLLGNDRTKLANVLPEYIRVRRWFRGKARRIKSISITDVIAVVQDPVTYLMILRVDYTEGTAETYILPVSFRSGEAATGALEHATQSVIARLKGQNNEEEAILFDPSLEPDFCTALLNITTGRRRLRGTAGELSAPQIRGLRSVLGTDGKALAPSIMKAEQSNTSIIYGDRVILKVFRRIEEGINPDFEIGRFLTEKVHFAHVPPVVGALEYQQGQNAPMTVAILQGFVPNEGDAWQYTLDSLSHYFEHALTSEREAPDVLRFSVDVLLDLADKDLPSSVYEEIGTYIEQARLLGQRTAELHCALASSPRDPQFAPEAFTALYQRSLYQSMRTQASQVVQLFRKNVPKLKEDIQAQAQKLLSLEKQILDRFRQVSNKKIQAQRTRYHGDYHLGQVLYTGKDFVIIDFEGEPARPLSERRIKQSPLRDVAGMLRSFRYAAQISLLEQSGNTVVRPEDMVALKAWANFWQGWVSVSFLKAYLETATQGTFLPTVREELHILLDVFVLEKAVYELGYEMNNRPDWIHVPIEGLLQLLEEE